MNLIFFYFYSFLIILIIFILIYKKRYRNEIFFFHAYQCCEWFILYVLSPLKTNYEMIDKSYYAMKKKIAIKRSKREK